MQFQPSVSAYDEIRRIYSLRGGPHIIAGSQSLHGGGSGGGGSSGVAAAPNESPKLIPAIIHQTYKSADVPQAVRPFMKVGTCRPRQPERSSGRLNLHGQLEQPLQH